jgi:hypothetical protein
MVDIFVFDWVYKPTSNCRYKKGTARLVVAMKKLSWF